jgi:hypothetical protein
VAFNAEELTIKVFPDSVLWAGGCPQDTMSKGKPCQDHTKNPCTQNTVPPDGGEGHPCPQDTMTPTTRPPRKASAAALPLLQAQLRERLAQGPVEAGLRAAS